MKNINDPHLFQRRTVSNYKLWEIHQTATEYTNLSRENEKFSMTNDVQGHNIEINTLKRMK